VTLSRKTPIARGTSTLTRTRLKASNPKRKASEFRRCYGSKARVIAIKALPCIVCGHGPCDNAHIKTDGAGRKADARFIVPLCCMVMDHPWSPGYPRGHHGLLHQIGVKSFQRGYHIDLDAEAAKIEALYPTEATND